MPETAVRNDKVIQKFDLERFARELDTSLSGEDNLSYKWLWIKSFFNVSFPIAVFSTIGF